MLSTIKGEVCPTYLVLAPITVKLHPILRVLTLATSPRSRNHGRTLHCAGANSTDTHRFTFILAFEVPPAPEPTNATFIEIVKK